MKLTKKLFIAALAVVGLTFAGCNMNEDKYGIIDFNAPDNHADVDFTNNTDHMQRAWKTFNSAHKTGTCSIYLDKSTGNGGNMGFIWGLEKNSDGSRNFFVATVNYGNDSNGNNFGYYVSYFKGVDPSCLEGTTSTFLDLDGKKITTTESATTHAKEIVIVDTWTSLTSINSTGKVSFVLGWEQNTGYTLRLYKEVDANGNGVSGKEASNIINIGSTKGLTAEEVASANAPDKGFGVYAMVNEKKTLRGTWDFPGFTAFSNINEIPE